MGRIEEKNKISEAVGHIEAMVASAGGKLSDEERDFLTTEPESLSEEQKRVLLRPLLAKTDVGFFTVAIDGYRFCPIELVKQKYGKSVEENYSGASNIFINFAISYWTLKEFAFDLSLDNGKTLVSQIFDKMERDVAAAFFPTPGPFKIVPNFLRRVDMKNILRGYWPQHLVDEFLKNNPILNR